MGIDEPVVSQRFILAQVPNVGDEVDEHVVGVAGDRRRGAQTQHIHTPRGDQNVDDLAKLRTVEFLGRLL